MNPTAVIGYPNKPNKDRLFTSRQKTDIYSPSKPNSFSNRPTKS